VSEQVEISEASIDDADELSALAVRTYVEAWGAEFEPDDLAWHLERTISPARWREHLLKDRVFWAHAGGEAVGFVQFGPSGRAGDMLIDRLYVDRTLQGQGIGSDLLRRALAEPECRKADAIRIDVWQDNAGARRLYERCGFWLEGEREPFVLQSGEIDGYDLILVRRREAA